MNAAAWRHRAAMALPGIVLLLVWQWASGRLIRTIYVSKPTDIAVRLYELFATGEILPHLAVTLRELVLGYSIGVVTGLACGYWLARAPRAARIVEPYVMGFYGIPKIALAPLFVIWFGIGIWSKVALSGTMVFFLVFYNVYAGVRGVDRELVALSRVMGANERKLGRHVYLPAAMPFIVLGMRMAIPYAVIGVIVGEFTSSIQGFGLVHPLRLRYLRPGGGVRGHRHPAGLHPRRRPGGRPDRKAGCCAGGRRCTRPTPMGADMLTRRHLLPLLGAADAGGARQRPGGRHRAHRPGHQRAELPADLGGPGAGQLRRPGPDAHLGDACPAATRRRWPRSMPATSTWRRSAATRC